MPLAYGDGHYEYGELVTKIMKEKGMSKDEAGAYVHGIEERQKSALLLALKLSKIKLKLADTYNDDGSPDNYQYDEGKVIKKAAEENNYLPAERDFRNQLSKGILVEMEKVKDQDIARSIAEDHLKEDIEYYRKLEAMRKFTVLGYAKMKLAAQEGKYAKYWILNAKDINGNGWGVSPSTIRTNIASFVGKPFVITANTWIPDSEYEGIYDHPYIPVDDMDMLLNYQDKFRVGNIDQIIEDENQDFHAMIAIDEKFRHLPLPPFCSPAIYQLDQNEPEGNITKWTGLHLAGLNENPAYGPRVAILKGSCVGSPGQCFTQFKQR